MPRSDIENKLADYEKRGVTAYLNASLIGVEKESLRVGHDGNISQKPHPTTLGSALTNPYITTDYSEALIEIITPPFPSIPKVLKFLEEVHQFVYKRLENEILWATSMPCVLAGEESVPIAQYGTSNLGKMKHIYRVGLGYRYGKVMQVIAGIHFNYSFSDAFWAAMYAEEPSGMSFQDYRSDQYFGLIRNLLRVGWMIPYLFGASPAICKSFLGERETGLQNFDAHTYYMPYATSLRMSDIGYQNNKENENGIKACYDSLAEYVKNLKDAISTPCPAYENIGVLVDGEYRQLNSNILQIENEYYSTVRPKQVLNKHEKPTTALTARGVQYLELRSIDVNVFDPFGINSEQLHFLETLMLYCLLEESPAISGIERLEIDENEMTAALEGRRPGLSLRRTGKDVLLRDWALEIFNCLQPVAELLDRVKQTGRYTISIQNLQEYILKPEMTPSARMLGMMRNGNESFHAFAKRMSIMHNNYFSQLHISREKSDYFDSVVRESLEMQQHLEEEKQPEFSEFLRQYFAMA